MPLIDMIKLASYDLDPATVIPAIVYDFAVFELKISSNAGFIDTGTVSVLGFVVTTGSTCANRCRLDKEKTIIRKKFW
jgi:hypothetical protein